MGEGSDTGTAAVVAVDLTADYAFTPTTPTRPITFPQARLSARSHTDPLARQPPNRQHTLSCHQHRPSDNPPTRHQIGLHTDSQKTLERVRINTGVCKVSRGHFVCSHRCTKCPWDTLYSDATLQSVLGTLCMLASLYKVSLGHFVE